MKDRSAIDTIKGYFYQFDFAILKILELKDEMDSITVEGIEDFDIKTATEESAFQCKYYAKTEYNHSVIAKPIRLMLNHFKEVKDGKKAPLNYFLYGYYKSGQGKLTQPINVNVLKSTFLTYKEKDVEYKHYETLNLSDTDLYEFLTKLNIRVDALEFDSQLKQIFNLLRSNLSCSEIEAEIFYYNNALKIIKDLSIQNNISDREITKKDFLARINNKRILFNEWFIEFKGYKALYKTLKLEYFSHLNISPYSRFFFIEVTSDNYLRSNIKDIILFISRKWSKLVSPDIKNLVLPYWMLNSEELEEFFLDTEANDHNQRYIFKESVVTDRKSHFTGLEEEKKKIHYVDFLTFAA